MRATVPVIDRLLPRCVETKDGCWRFTGALSANGYGMIGAGGRGGSTLYAHRFTYAYFIADVPPGLDLDHLCRNRACCNPWHLEPVTRKVNVDRGVHGSDKPQGFHEYCKRGHALTDDNVYVWVSSTRKNPLRNCRTCRRNYKIAARVSR